LGHRDARVLGRGLSPPTRQDDILIERSCSTSLDRVLSERDEAAVNGSACFIQPGEIAGQSAGPRLIPDMVERLRDALEKRDQSLRIIVCLTDIEHRCREGSETDSFITGSVCWLRIELVTRRQVSHSQDLTASSRENLPAQWSGSDVNEHQFRAYKTTLSEMK
jgi:hypothetical protein